MHIGLIARTDTHQVEEWARTEGMTVIRTVGRLIRVDASAEIIANAFHLTWIAVSHGWHTDDVPLKPDGIAHVVGLSTRGHAHHMHVYSDPARLLKDIEGFPPISFNGIKDYPGYTPADILAAYQADVPWTGTGERVGICEWDQDMLQSDLDLFCSLLGLPPVTPTIQNVGGYVPSGGVGAEANLDVQWVHGIAPGAAITVYQGSAGVPADPNSFTDQFAAWALEVTEMLNTIAAEPDPPSVLNISYGNMESSFTSDDLEAWDLAMTDLGDKGCTVVVSTGDQGRYGDHAPHYPQTAEACAPASCVHAFAVGGTTLFSNNGTYGPEWGWTNWFGMGASGGGFSNHFAEPSWQFGTVGKRQIPDVSAAADPTAPAFFVINGAPNMVGGTSWAAPIMAGLLARLNHARRLAHFHPLGFFTGVLYDEQRQGHGLCTDITIGNNTFDSVTGANAQRGYDWVTGWGSPLFPVWMRTFAWGAPLPPAPASSPSV